MTAITVNNISGKMSHSRMHRGFFSSKLLTGWRWCIQERKQCNLVSTPLKLLSHFKGRYTSKRPATQLIRAIWLNGLDCLDVPCCPFSESDTGFWPFIIFYRLHPVEWLILS